MEEGNTFDWAVFEINAEVPASVAVPAIVGNAEMPQGSHGTNFRPLGAAYGPARSHIHHMRR